MLFALLLAAAAPTVAVVAGDPAQDADVAERVASSLMQGGRVSATRSAAAVDAGCARTPTCAARPTTDFTLIVSTPAPARVRVELIRLDGALATVEDVEIPEASLVDAALAPALQRVVDAALRSTPSPQPGGSPPTDNGVSPWLLGALGVGGAACVVALGGAFVYVLVASANAAGTAAGNSCADAIGKSCAGIGNAFSGIGDACAGLGQLGSCAAPIGALVGTGEDADAPRPVDGPASAGAMRY